MIKASASTRLLVGLATLAVVVTACSTAAPAPSGPQGRSI